MTRARSLIVVGLMMVSMAFVWSSYETDGTSLRLETFYGPMCVPTGWMTTCSDIVQSRLVTDYSTRSGESTGAETPARFACAAISIAVLWKRRQWTKKLARGVVVGGLMFVAWQTYGAVVKPGVMAFLGGLLVVWLGQRDLHGSAAARSSVHVSSSLVSTATS